jgi:serine O-acetyltransferase
VCLVHPNNLYFGPKVTLGDNCLVHHEVTLGMGTVPGTPQLGQNVVLYPGARVQGGITIGDDVIIGANCVVTRNIAPNTVVQPAANRMMPRTMLPKSRQLDRQQQEG